MSGPSSPTVEMKPTTDALKALRRVLLNLADAIDANLPGTIAGTDPEHLHELRVAVRRTRSVLHQIKGVLPDDLRTDHQRFFAELGRATGAPRDLDVQTAGWSDLVSALDPDDAIALEVVRTELEGRRAAAKVKLAEHLQSDEVRDQLARWRAWLTDPDVGRAGRPIGPILAERIERAQRRVLRDGRKITDESEAERLHDLRKDAKKLRYLFECFGGAMPKEPRKAFVAQLKALQENLGEHQDAAVQIDTIDDLRSRADLRPDVSAALGELTASLEQHRDRERRVFAERFAAYDTKRNRKALERLLDPLR